MPEFDELTPEQQEVERKNPGAYTTEARHPTPLELSQQVNEEAFTIAAGMAPARDSGLVVVNADGEHLTFAPGEEMELRAALKQGYAPADTVGIVNPSTGDAVGVQDPDDLSRLLGQGFKIEGPAAAPRRGLATDRRERLDDEYGAVGAAGQAGLRGLSFGLLGSGEDADALREQYPTASVLGEITGLLAGGVGATTSGVAGKFLRATPAGAATRAAVKAGQRFGRGSVVRTAAIEGAVEGGLYSAGNTLADVVTQDKPFAVESLATSFGTGVLFGGGVGAGVGLAGKAIARKAALDDLAELSAPVTRRVRDMDVQAVRLADLYEDVAGTRLAQKAHRPGLPDDVFRPTAGTFDNPQGQLALGLEKGPQRGFDDFLREGGGSVAASRPVSVRGAPTTAARDAVAEFREARQLLVKELGEDLQFQLDDLVRREPAAVVDSIIPAINRYETAVRQLDSVAGTRIAADLDDTLLPKLAEQVPRHARENTLAVHALDAAAVADLAGVPVEQLPVAGPLASAVLKSYAFGRGLGLAASRQAPQFLSRIRGDVPRFAADTATRTVQPKTVTGSFGQKFRPHQSQDTAVGVAGDLLSGGSLLSRVVRRVVASPLDNVQGIASKVLRTREQISKRVRRAVRAVDTPGGRAHTVATASAILGATQFHFQKDKEAEDVATQRANEIRRAVAEGSTFRDQLSARVAPLLATNLQLGHGLIEHTMRKLQFLYTKLPAMPSYGFETEPLSGAQAAEWARYVKAANDPLESISGIADGSITPEEVEAIQTLYPRLYEEIRFTIMEEAAELRGKMPYTVRVTVSTLFDLNLEPTLEPGFVMATQRLHTAAQVPLEGGISPISGVPDPIDEPTKGQRLAGR